MAFPVVEPWLLYAEPMLAHGQRIFGRAGDSDIHPVNNQSRILGIGLDDDLAFTLAEPGGIFLQFARGDFDFSIPFIGAVSVSRV